ncbi:MAG: protein arginine kinase [Candidatus Abyssobacteria bacterium SURF_17]|jgi:protein arginine kinase|uniref:Protein arginine kinase n=1 Tax=Candidatus Abyssobacteria bacterium SURF_17 TaxID=2093361 RepID=A0A419F825_9BACT|nr:MAG: protein arginine kinase [Candidatus Abyssubacteria bacterium SURF_17]
MFEQMLSTVGHWLKEKGPDSDIVYSSRIRLARNLRGFPFSNQCSEQQLRDIISLVRSCSNRCSRLKGAQYYSLKDMAMIDRQFLMERFLVSRELAQTSGEKGVIVDAAERICLMINEEDHLRMQVLRSGLMLSAAWEELNAIDDEMDSHLDFAYEEPWGYLTACVSNAGTALRASVMVHIPGLSMTKRILGLLQNAGKMQLAIRGLHGEGSELLGDYFQISNQVTLGKSEDEIVEMTENLTRQLIDQERSARDDLMKNQKIVIEDKVGRALGILSGAKMLSTREAMELLSSIRLGVYFGMIPGMRTETLDSLLIGIHPAHLQKRFPEHLDPLARDIKRAKLIKEALKYGEG